MKSVIANIDTLQTSRSMDIAFYVARRENERTIKITKLNEEVIYNLLISNVDLRKLLTWKYIIESEVKTR